MLTSIKEWFLKVFLVTYLKDFLNRLRGYRTFLGFILTMMQVASQLALSPEATSILGVLIKAFSDVATGQLDPQDLTIVATSLYSLYGVVMKIFKKITDRPQIPTIITEKL